MCRANKPSRGRMVFVFMSGLRVLGSTSGLVPGNRFCTSLVVDIGDGLVVLDAGAPLATLLPQAGIEFSAIRALLLTHWHADHSAGLPLLLQRLWLHNAITAPKQGTPPVIIPLYGPPLSAYRLDLLRSFYLLPFDDVLRRDIFPLPVTDMGPDERIDLGGSASAFMYLTTHWTHAHAQRLINENFGVPPVGYGIRLETEGHTLVYSGDAGSPDDCRPYLAGADLLVHELGHFHAGEVALVAKDSGVPRLLLVHLSAEYHGDSGSARAISEARDAGYQGEVIVANDGLEVPF